MNLRNAKTSDLELTYRIKKNSIKPYVEKIWTWNDQLQKTIHEKNFTSSDTKIIELDGKDVGYLVLKRHNRRNSHREFTHRKRISEFGNWKSGNAQHHCPS